MASMIIKDKIYTTIFVTYLISFTVIFLTLFTYFLDFENFRKYTIYVIVIILTLLIIPPLLGLLIGLLIKTKYEFSSDALYRIYKEEKQKIFNYSEIMQISYTLPYTAFFLNTYFATLRIKYKINDDIVKELNIRMSKRKFKKLPIRYIKILP